MLNMKTFDFIISNDHAGFALKKEIINYFKKKKISFLDVGADNDSQSVDYPDYADKALENMIIGISNRAILICATGIGMSIAANRRSIARAALCNSPYAAKMSRAHNDANILVLGSREITKELAFEIIDNFISTNFEGGRHIARLNKIR